MRQFHTLRLSLKAWLESIPVFLFILPYAHILIYSSIAFDFLNVLSGYSLGFFSGFSTVFYYLFFIGVLGGLTQKNLIHVCIGLVLGVVPALIYYPGFGDAIDLVIRGYLAYQLFRYDSLKEKFGKTDSVGV